MSKNPHVTNLAKQNYDLLGLLDATRLQQILSGLTVDVSVRQVKLAAVVVCTGCRP